MPEKEFDLIFGPALRDGQIVYFGGSYRRYIGLRTEPPYVLADFEDVPQHGAGGSLVILNRAQAVDRPDPQFVTVMARDGRPDPWFVFAVSFKTEDGGCFSVQLWARSFEHAEQQLTALKNNGRVDGQLFSEIPY